jgi:DNA helicase HerA-like ATPase
VKDVEECKTVLVDLARDPVVARYYSEMICKAVLAHQMTKFSELEAAEFEKKSVLFYFEEAHNLFRADDKDLTSVYNKLAKEGAKFRIGMAYATQSMTTLSPDLLKNTENFFIAHLNDDREIREIERRYEFSGIGLDVQRARTKGYVRMITLSHRYALPVQIKLFRPPEKSPPIRPSQAAEDELPF